MSFLLGLMVGKTLSDKEYEDRKKMEAIKPDKENLKKTWGHLRKLSQSVREYLSKHLAEKSDNLDDLESATKLLISVLTGDYIKIPFNKDKRFYLTYQKTAPCLSVRLDFDAREKFENDVFSGVKYLQTTNHQERDEFLTELVKPHTPKEIEAWTVEEEIFNKNAAEKARKEHEYAMANNPQYREFIERKDNPPKNEIGKSCLWGVGAIVLFFATLGALKKCTPEPVSRQTRIISTTTEHVHS